MLLGIRLTQKLWIYNISVTKLSSRHMYMGCVQRALEVHALHAATTGLNIQYHMVSEQDTKQFLNPE